MNDDRVSAALDRLAPPAPATGGWDDVLRRARRARVRRRLSLSLALAATGVALATSLAAAAELRSLLQHTQAPHLVLRSQLRTPDGAPAGTFTIEIPRAAVALRGRPVLQTFGREESFHARWFLDLAGVDGELATGALSVPSGVDAGSPVAVLCERCGTQDSGRIELSQAQAAAIVSDRVTFAIATRASRPVAAGRLQLDRSNLRRGVACQLDAGGHMRCTRIYTGRSR